jgi:hypothetical protein
MAELVVAPVVELVLDVPTDFCIALGLICLSLFRSHPSRR